MGKSKPKMEVVEYYMSIHYGICAGPIDEIRGIVVDKKEAWSGSMTAQAVIPINKPELFGGVKKEGGAIGSATYLPGGADQVMPEGLASKLRLTSATCPAYRGISSIFFAGSTRGFYWRANSPYLPGTWIVARRRPRGLSSNIAMIGDDANPAHIIYEALTNSDWGMGANPASINRLSFEAAAQTLFDENFGLSLLWTQSETVENFVSGVIDHIEAALFVNPRDGLLTLKLIRDDYVEADLPRITPDNAKMTNFQRKLWGETINEIVVSWTNPANEETETVVAQDLANISIQGGIVSEPKSYPGIRKSSLAMKVANRDLRVASSPLAMCNLIVDRSKYDIFPGSCVKVYWPDHGMDGVVMRVGPVDYGTTGDSSIKFQATEDVWSLPQADYEQPPTSGWIDPSELPAPITWSLIFTLPYYLAVNIGDQYEDWDYPLVPAAILAAQPGSDTAEFVVASQVSDATGASKVELGRALSITPRGTIGNPLFFEASSTVAVLGVSQGQEYEVGSLAIMGTTDEGMEICVVTSIAGNLLTLRRGVLDTVPRVWSINTPIWFVTDGMAIDEGEGRIAQQSFLVRLLSVTSKGRLGWNATASVGGVMTGRPHLPSRPANVSVGGVTYGILNAEGMVSIPVTWSNRNRLMEDSVVLAWTAASVAPESAQTTTVSVHDLDGNLVTAHTGLTGASFALPIGSFGSLSEGLVRVSAERDGLESLQAHEIRVRVNAGYGYGYGRNYGGI